jgi:hypothetical protein
MIIALMMEAASNANNFYQNKRRCGPKDRHLHTRLSE